ncbi:expressed unknown protein [Ectocarpus siliculosus]|uniref:Uncharacterized protein n=1 Tax=Ectocarpus siliculosus TaxID=2880 RepID=D7FL52_ECTSI|nr:expressed unknown protein [Ectocarpus siliculosus]|eukprot:CBJ29589.1 expressed unknown protein [Ectocarpus siliculosus]
MIGFRTVLALEASRQTAARREAGDSSCASFRAAGDGHAQKVMSLGGEETPVQGEDSDAEVVAVANPSSAASAGKKKKRVSPKWSTWSDLTLMKHAQDLASGWPDRHSVEDRWALVVEDLNKEPYVRVFGSKTVKHLKSRFDSHIRAQTKKNEEAAKASGAGNTSADDLEGDEAELEKLVQSAVDSRAGERADSRQEKARKAGQNLLGLSAIDMGNSRCGPGAAATTFGEAHASEERRMSGVIDNRRRMPGFTPSGSGSGRSSPANIGGVAGFGSGSGNSSGSGSGRSSPATAGGVTLTPPLGSTLAALLRAPTIERLASKVGVTREQADLFLNVGFRPDQIPHDVATRMMEDVIADYFMGLRDGKSVDAYVRDIVAADEDADGMDPVDTSKAPGLDRFGNLTHALFAHYNQDYASSTVLPYAERYRLGWLVLEGPSDEIFDGLTRTLASRLVFDGSDTPLDFAGGGGGADDDGDSGDDDAPPDKQAKRKGKSGRKIRTNTSKKEETDMNRATREDAAAIRSEKKAEDRYQRERDERQLDRKHERDMRADERREEREDRDKREAAEAARRAEEKAHKERDQTFELEMMRLKVQLAVAESKKP